MHRLDVDQDFTTDPFDGFAIAIVTAGEGYLAWDDGETPLRPSDELFLPASVGSLFWKCVNQNPLTVVICFPPN